MESELTRFINTPEGSLVFIFTKNDILFPFVHDYVDYKDMNMAAELVGNSIIAEYTGSYATVHEWNSYIDQGGNPLELMERLTMGEAIDFGEKP
jgi:hypothetical protein